MLPSDQLYRFFGVSRAHFPLHGADDPVTWRQSGHTPCYLPHVGLEPCAGGCDHVESFERAASGGGVQREWGGRLGGRPDGLIEGFLEHPIYFEVGALGIE